MHTREHGQQVFPEEILLLTGAKRVRRLHGRETAEDLLHVAEVSRSRLRLALLFSVTLLILVIRDASVFSGPLHTGGTVALVGSQQQQSESYSYSLQDSSFSAGTASLSRPPPLLANGDALASQPCAVRRVTASTPEALSTPELRDLLAEVHATCWRPPSDWSLTRVLPPLQDGVRYYAAHAARLLGWSESVHNSHQLSPHHTRLFFHSVGPAFSSLPQCPRWDTLCVCFRPSSGNVSRLAWSRR